MASTFSNVCVLTALATLVLLYRRRLAQAKIQGNLPLPPGPPPLPLIGNLRDLPLGVPQWEVYGEMARKYGDIVHMQVLGKHIIVLSSQSAINDLLEKRSSIYSSRPRSTMMHELMGMEWSLAIMEYGEEWRQIRKAVHQRFNVNESRKYRGIQSQTTWSFLRRVLKRPEGLFEHTRHLFAKSIMKVTYGIDVEEENDPYMYNAEQVIVAFNTAARPGRYLVDLIPIMKYIPAWFPGAQFQRDALFARDVSAKMLHNPFDAVKERENAGVFTPCVVSSLLDELPDGPGKEEGEDIIKKAAGIAYAGGSDTTVSALRSFFLAMILYPEVQKKAQAELDGVVGPGRLPEFDDMDSLPYIVALTKETLRWKMVLPLGVPHLTSESDEYRGYYIPRGSIIMGNSHAILHDPNEFPEPHEFIPDRFIKEDGQLDPDVLDPTAVCFGYGRRICPGSSFAQDSLFSVIASVLHTFDISHARSEHGVRIPVRPDMTAELISYPKPFSYSIKPRSPSAEALIRNTEEG